jgi:hypothetical protein
LLCNLSFTGIELKKDLQIRGPFLVPTEVLESGAPGGTRTHNQAIECLRADIANLGFDQPAITSKNSALEQLLAVYPKNGKALKLSAYFQYSTDHPNMDLAMKAKGLHFYPRVRSEITTNGLNGSDRWKRNQ